MYPGPTGSALNHKRDCCSDGVQRKLKDGQPNDDELPQWPQPPNVFTKGTHFHPRVFLAMIREVYERVAEQNGTESEFSMEDLAFCKLLMQRVKVCDNGTVLFKLFQHLVMPPDTPDGLLVVIDNCKYLQVDCLRT